VRTALERANDGSELYDFGTRAEQRDDLRFHACRLVSSLVVNGKAVYESIGAYMRSASFSGGRGGPPRKLLCEGLKTCHIARFTAADARTTAREANAAKRMIHVATTCRHSARWRDCARA
jgi:hypothetical protein